MQSADFIIHSLAGNQFAISLSETLGILSRESASFNYKHSLQLLMFAFSMLRELIMWESFIFQQFIQLQPRRGSSISQVPQVYIQTLVSCTNTGFLSIARLFGERPVFFIYFSIDVLRSGLPWYCRFYICPISSTSNVPQQSKYMYT